ncbi:MerR family transcriptional regulator [Thalassolituus sp. LLYu03]|uniref:MerR family transcriptional regulator n=1 Tax=Thalassolituus sp. LLYu03 TaxID=3421656 RepID=UPI003D2742DF
MSQAHPMYRISELAERAGLSRSTLLYYEKLALIRGRRQGNGYRVYSDEDLQRLRLIQSLQAGGLTLSECKICLEQRLDRGLLQQRLQALEQDIDEKLRARSLLRALLGDRSLSDWHHHLNALAPDAHNDWLRLQGFSDKDIHHLKWLSKDMNTHDQYMADFMRIYTGLARWAPGSEQDTLRALASVPVEPGQILEIGCGQGIATRVLLANTRAHITATDNEEAAMAGVRQTLADAGFDQRLTTHCADMQALPFAAASFDLIWSEGSAYVMGLEKALASWRPLLQDGGCLVLSDLVWLTEKRPAAVSAYWAAHYPDMVSRVVREEQMRAAGFAVLDSFVLSEAAWTAYYGPLAQQVGELAGELVGSAALADIERELAICTATPRTFGYQMFILQKG